MKEGFARVALSLSGLLNLGMGLALAFVLQQPPTELALASHPRLAYIRYIFSAHGFLVAQLGMLELFSTIILAHPIAYVCSAFIVAVGDIFFGLSIWNLIQSGYVPSAGEPEVDMMAVYWAALEFVVMMAILLTNWPAAKKNKKTKRK